LLMFANCFVWTTFCFIRGIDVMYEPLIVNSYGLCVTIVALLVYARYITEDAVRASFIRKVPLTMLGLVLLAVTAFTSGTNDCTDPSSFKCWWGKFCIVVNSALFVGPFVAFREAWASKSVEFMPLASIVSGLIASRTARCTSFVCRTSMASSQILQELCFQQCKSGSMCTSCPSTLQKMKGFFIVSDQLPNTSGNSRGQRE